MDTSCLKPHIFYNFFYGKRSDNLPEIAHEPVLSEIFPEERDQFSEEIESMYFGKNINDRSLDASIAMLREDNPITKETLTMQNELIVSYCKYKLEQKCNDPQLDDQQLKEDIIKAIAFVRHQNVSSILVPFPNSLSTRISASWIIAPCFTIDRPRPVPPLSLEWLLSTR